MSKQQEYLEIPTQSVEENHLPTYSSEWASGADVRAHLDEDLPLPPGKSVLVPTGLRFAIPEGYEIQVRPRSGLALKHQITVLNTPGTIDSDYRGELGVILINHSNEIFLIKPGMRIAQLVVAPVIQAKFFAANELAETSRGSGGFGHTGFH
ncbi:MAG: Deoxyuridine 5'-triphosphate nucleotidohydrolase [Chlamydiae bacterium]|nr:Deoxyuridine 5'-triphosphate nucleotidohydrolase [Chlamydiota bacterium]